ncbi:MAG: 2-oxoacid:acceptor oxidoreductase family protein [Coriobacteriia bacterium]|nr:2-oxoacid:acceptor oxidoreductase family protein [Coriobacteriia bacterium]
MSSDYGNLNLVLAGFGGQGILFAGKLVATAGLLEDRAVSWLPSYGPEMRGGTANCSVCLSDEPIGSPLVTDPDVLIAMNQPSFDLFYPLVVSGGLTILDSLLVPVIEPRDEVPIFGVPATQLADDEGLHGLANVMLVGKLWREHPFCAEETLQEALAACVPPRKQQLLEPNRRALHIGLELA